MAQKRQSLSHLKTISVKHEEEFFPLETSNTEELINVGKIAVGSLFISDDHSQQKWLELQLSYLKSTTKNFDHFAVISNKKGHSFDHKTNVLPHAPIKSKQSGAHIQGLKILLDFFKTKNEYSWFLFMDSDAFPIRANWLQTLSQKMKNQYEVAVPIRFENLEQRLHASILLAKPEALNHLDFSARHIGNDLLNGSENDVTIGSYQNERRQKAYVLLRSNKYNVNPLLCGVYYDMFYHHCCGSGRNYNMRGRDYWNHVAHPMTDVSVFTNQLMQDPDAFIGKLAGWNSNLYARKKNEHTDV